MRWVLLLQLALISVNATLFSRKSIEFAPKETIPTTSRKRTYRTFEGVTITPCLQRFDGTYTIQIPSLKAFRANYPSYSLSIGAKVGTTIHTVRPSKDQSEIWNVKPRHDEDPQITPYEIQRVTKTLLEPSDIPSHLGLLQKTVTMTDGVIYSYSAPGLKTRAGRNDLFEFYCSTLHTGVYIKISGTDLWLEAKTHVLSRTSFSFGRTPTTYYHLVPV